MHEFTNGKKIWNQHSPEHTIPKSRLDFFFVASKTLVASVLNSHFFSRSFSRNGVQTAYSFSCLRDRVQNLSCELLAVFFSSFHRLLLLIPRICLFFVSSNEIGNGGLNWCECSSFAIAKRRAIHINNIYVCTYICITSTNNKNNHSENSVPHF